MVYRAGDFWRICDRCGFKTRSSRTAKEWNNLVVCLHCYEERHPQDFVRGVRDIQNVPDPRPDTASSNSIFISVSTVEGIQTEAGEFILTETGERIFTES